MAKTADLASLKFDLILDDKQFNKKVQETITSAQQLNTQLSDLLNIQKQTTRVTEADVESNKQNNKILKDNAKAEQAIRKEVEKTTDAIRKQKEMNDATIRGANARARTAESEELAKQAQAHQRISTLEEKHKRAVLDTTTAQERLSLTLERQKAAMIQTSIAQQRLNRLKEEEVNKMTATNKLWEGIKTLTAGYFSVLGAKTLLTNLVQISAEFEKQRISLEAILGDIRGADALFNRIRQLALMSPFNFKELASYTKQLAAFSVPMEDLYDTTKMLADVSAGLGVGMDRIILAYGQIRSASFLRGQEVRQLTEAGVPILQELSKMLTEIEGKYVSVGEVFDKISSRQVTFEMVNQIFKDMTSEGGKFYRMQEVLADTLSGKLSNLKDAYQNMFYEIGQSNNSIISGSVDTIRNLIENYEKVGKVLVELIKIYGTYKAVVLASSAIDVASRMYKVIVNGKKLSLVYDILAKRIKASAAAQAMMNATAKLNPYVAVAAAVTGLGVALYRLMTIETEAQKIAKQTSSAMEDAKREMITETQKLQVVFRELENAAVGTEEYNKAKKDILTTYDAYLTDLDRENLALGEQAGLYDSILQKIRANIGAKALESTNQILIENYSNSMNRYMEEYEDFIKRYSKTVGEIPETVVDEIAKYMRGEIVDPRMMTEAARNFYSEMQDAVKRTAPKNVFDGAWGHAPYVATYFDIDRTRELIQRENQELENGLAEGKKRIERIWGKWGDESEELVLKAWQEKIKTIIDKASGEGITMNLDYTNVGLTSVIEEVQKRIKELTEEEKNYRDIDNEIADSLARQLKYWNEINDKALGGKATTNNNTTSDAVKALTNQISDIRNLMSLYEELTEQMSDEEAIKAINKYYRALYGDLIDADWEVELNKLIDELKLLGEEGRMAADTVSKSLAEALAKKFVKSAKESNDAIAKFNKLVAEWSPTSKLSGEGTALDISQTIAEYQKANQSALEEREKNFELLYEAKAAGADADKVMEMSLKVSSEYETQIANNYLKASDKIHSAIKSMAKDLLSEQGFDFTDMSKMSISQLKDLQNAINSLDITSLNEQQVEALKSAGFTIEMITKAIGEYADESREKVHKWLKEYTSKTVISALNAIKSLMSDIAGYAQEIGDAKLSKEVENITNGIDIVSSTLNGFSQGGVIGGVISGVSAIAQVMIKNATESERMKNQLREAKLEAEQLTASLNLANGVDTWFGTNTITSIKNATEGMEKYRKLMKDISHYKNLQDMKQKAMTKREEAYYAQPVIWARKRAEELGLALTLEDGTYSLDTLNAIKDMYENQMTSAQKEWLDKAITYAQAYKDADDQLTDIIKDTWSGLADSIADSMLNAFSEMGDASYNLAENMDDIFNDLGKSIAKSLISSFVIDEVLLAYKKQLLELTTNMQNGILGSEDIVSGLAEIAQGIKNDINDKVGIIQEFLTQMELAGFDFSSDTNSNTISNGITSITEETANLLASYVNGMRADLAGHRVEVQGIASDVKVLLGLVPKSLSLEDYLTRIEAHTADNALNTASILNRLESIIGDGATSFVRVQ